MVFMQGTQPVDIARIIPGESVPIAAAIRSGVVGGIVNGLVFVVIRVDAGPEHEIQEAGGIVIQLGRSDQFPSCHGLIIRIGIPIQKLRGPVARPGESIEFILGQVRQTIVAVIGLAFIIPSIGIDQVGLQAALRISQGRRIVIHIGEIRDIDLHIYSFREFYTGPEVKGILVIIGIWNDRGIVQPRIGRP